MSIANLIRHPNLGHDQRGRKLSQDQIAVLKEMRKEADEGIDEAVGALELVAGYLLGMEEAKETLGLEGVLSTASWSVDTLAKTIGALRFTIEECRFHLEDDEDEEAKA